jgi:hypothetical protein
MLGMYFGMIGMLIVAIGGFIGGRMFKSSEAQ